MAVENDVWDDSPERRDAATPATPEDAAAEGTDDAGDEDVVDAHVWRAQT